jgi:hypothetical protein
VVSHGIPYMALIYLNDKKKQHQFISFLFFEGARGNAFLLVLCFYRFCEEYFGNFGLENSLLSSYDFPQLAF